jgi:hypothetical protein
MGKWDKAFELVVGRRVRVDMSCARSSLPKDRWGLLSPAGVRLAWLLEEIVDASNQRPFVTEVRQDDVEIATSNFGEGMKCMRVPRTAIAIELGRALAVELPRNAPGAHGQSRGVCVVRAVQPGCAGACEE